MTQRITKHILEKRVEYLNKLTGAPLKPFKEERDSNGRLQINEGTYTIGGAYGGFRLEQNGGSRDISPRCSKRELYEWINAYIDGIEVGRKLTSNEES